MEPPTYLSFIAYVRANPDSDPPGTLVHCTRCGVDQEPAQFYLRSAREKLRKTGRLRNLCTCCRTCQKAASLNYRSDRLAVMRKAKEGGCVDCGLVDLEHPMIFDFDHVHGDKVKGVAEWLTSGTIDDMLAEIARCEVVCANCHRIRT